MDVWEAIRKKRAVRKFTDKPLPDDVIERILDAGRRAQSSKNTQPWEFIVVRDSALLQELAKAGDYMSHVAGAAACIGLVSHQSGIKPMFDLGQCAAYMQLVALELGVGSVLGSVYRADDAKKLLGIPADVSFDMVISFGYPAEAQQRPAVKGGRRPLNEIVHWDRW